MHAGDKQPPKKKLSKTPKVGFDIFGRRIETAVEDMRFHPLGGSSL